METYKRPPPPTAAPCHTRGRIPSSLATGQQIIQLQLRSFGWLWKMWYHIIANFHNVLDMLYDISKKRYQSFQQLVHGIFLESFFESSQPMPRICFVSKRPLEPILAAAWLQEETCHDFFDVCWTFHFRFPPMFLLGLFEFAFFGDLLGFLRCCSFYDCYLSFGRLLVFVAWSKRMEKDNSYGKNNLFQWNISSKFSWLAWQFPGHIWSCSGLASM